MEILIEKSSMRVDPKWGRFPVCPEMSPSVTICLLLSRFVLGGGSRREKRMDEDTTGYFGTNWGQPASVTKCEN